MKSFYYDMFLQYRDPNTGEWISHTYGQVLGKATKLAYTLKISHGVERGDWLVTFSETTVQWVIIDIAIQMLGAVVVSLHTGFSSSNAVKVIHEIKPKVLFGDQKFLRSMIECEIELQQANQLQDFTLNESTCIVNTGNGDIGQPFETLIDNVDSEIELLDIADPNILDDTFDTEEPSSVFFTSGTTGFPKGVIHSHRSLVGSCDQFASHYGWLMRGRVLLLHFPSSQMHQTALLSMACTGLSITIEPEVVREYIAEVKPHYIFSNPQSMIKIRKIILRQVNSMPLLKKRSVKAAIRRGIENTKREIEEGAYYQRSKVKGTFGLDPKILSMIREQSFGLDLRCVWVSMAKSDPSTNEFFWGLGVKVFDCYGSTEV
eukprot:TRINITY_DN1661_c0_g1_i4.p1 TRINITY_DN1661_c0_g1~~TRINITY_DN1661_c0_g1_i4.p1  ORF type:complete len:375 (+),score=75.69 TRINITY_DN1661_c0_g1_i4:756-1880(+)